MKERARISTNITGKQFLVGMIAAGILTTGLVTPSAASALSVSGAGDDSSSTANAIDLGTVLIDGSLQGGAGAAQGSNVTSGNSHYTTGSSNSMSGKGGGTLHVQSTPATNGSSRNELKGDGQVSGKTSVDAQNVADNNDATGSEQSDSSSSISLQGSAQLRVNVAADPLSNTDKDLFSL